MGERWEQKVSAQRTPYFPFLKRILIPGKNIFLPLVPAVSLESGAFGFSTRIKDRVGKPPPARSQRPAERGVSKDSGILPQRRLRWSLKGLFGFQVVGGLRKSRGPRRLPVFSPTLCTATAGQRRNRRNNPAQSWRPKSAGQGAGKEDCHGAQGGRSRGRTENELNAFPPALRKSQVLGGLKRVVQKMIRIYKEKLLLMSPFKTCGAENNNRAFPWKLRLRCR